MKKVLLLPALLAGSLVFSQQKNELVAPPPPPEPPKVESPAPPPMPPKPAPPPVDDYGDFMKRNKNVKSLGWSDDGNTMRVHLKSGKEDVYDLGDRAQKQKAESIYGKLPIAPPPPPAPPSPKMPPPPPVEQ
ncbi:MAG: hypothetical protein ACXWV0_07490 [Flavisolibacter sp.]